MVVLVALLVHAAIAAAEQSTIVFALEDQWGKTWSSSSLRGKPYVLVLADRDGAEAAVTWGEQLGKRLKDTVRVLGCAHLDGVPSFVRWLVRSSIRSRVQDAPLLLDWDGELCRTVRCVARVPTVLVVGPDGQIRFRYEGLPHGNAIEQVIAAVYPFMR